MNSWRVTVDFRSPGAEIGVDDSRLAACEELLREHMGRIRAGVDGDLYSVTLLVDAPTPGAALDIAGEVIGHAASRSELPAWSVVRSEQVRSTARSA